MTSRVTVDVGTAHVELDAALEVRTASGKASITYLYDDALHAVMRLGVAVVAEKDQADLLKTLSDLRKRLLGGPRVEP